MQEAVLLAETVAAVEASKSISAAEEVQGITYVYVWYVDCHRYRKGGRVGGAKGCPLPPPPVMVSHF